MMLLKYKKAQTALNSKLTCLQNRLIDMYLGKFKDQHFSVHDKNDLLGTLRTYEGVLAKKLPFATKNLRNYTH